MKKSVNYVVNIKIINNVDLMEAECECAAGMGLTSFCKHVGAMMIGLMKLNKGEVSLTKQTCTEILQDFHKPRNINTSTPIIAHNIVSYLHICSLCSDINH